VKLIDRIRRQPAYVSFGRSSQDSGFVNVELAAVPAPASVTLTAADGSAAPIPAADSVNAGVMSAVDKAKLDGLHPTDLPSRAALSTASIDPAVSHVRTAGYQSTGDGGGGIYRRVGAEPAHALKVRSADLAWWELVPDSHGFINVRQAGAVGNDVTNDGQAFRDALAFASLNANANEKATVGVIVPPGNFYLGATTLELKASVRLTGQGSGTAGTKPTRLRWDANVTGIIVHRHNTIGATTELDPAALGANGSAISGLWLKSDGGAAVAVTDGTKGHGIWLRARAVLSDLRIEGFPGNGIHIVTVAGGSADIEGNANGWTVERARITACHQNGVFVDGPDVNAGMAQLIDASSNGRWGIWDSSFLGNTYVACHTSSNGEALIAANGAGQSSLVHYNGPENGNTDLRYAANVAATEAQLVATTPGTNEAVWIKVEAAGAHPNVPTWIAAQPTGTYFHGGAYLSDGSNARNVFVGCYQESGQAPAQLAVPATALGGLISTYEGNGYGFVDGDLRGVVKVKNHQLFAPARDLEVRLNAAVNHLVKLLANGDHVSGLNLVAWDEAAGQWMVEHANSGSRRPIRFTTDLNTMTHGRASAQTGGELYFHKGFWIGNGAGQAKWFGGFRAKPTSGDHARGDLMLNYNPIAPGDPAGWRITTAGSIGAGAVLEEYFFLPDLPANRGKAIRPHASSNRVEWRDAAKAGSATISGGSGSQAISFTTAFADANYAVTLSPNGDELVWVTAKTASGFTVNRSGVAGTRGVDWAAITYENL